MPRASRWPAYLDALQSISGLILALFMWLHMGFVSSILISEKAFWTIARMFEGYFILGRALPQLVSGFVLLIWLLLVLHALLAMRKFPDSWRQYRTIWRHQRSFKHADTGLWLLQVVTGFLMFFLAPVHLYAMFAEPELIDPYGSADLVWSGFSWPLLALLLLCVELHGLVGLYRLALKWGWPRFGDATRSRKILKRLLWLLIVLFIGVGCVTLSTFMRIGYHHAAHAGELYQPLDELPATAEESH